MIRQDLILRYIHGDTSYEETKEVIEWIKANDENKKTYLRIRQLNDILIWNSKSEQSTSRKTKTGKIYSLTKFLRPLTGIAAMLICVFAIGYLYTQHYDLPDEKMQVLTVPPGQRAEITLIDGTKVWLNAGSTLHFPNHFEKQRLIKLEGEGYFDVKKDPNRPFIVETPRHQVKVHGTCFNVCAYLNNPYEVSLINGSVSVYSKLTKETILLNPGEKAKESYGAHLEKQKIMNYDPFLWKQGIVSFCNEPVENIFHKLELYYDIKIIVKNKLLLQKQYTGKFKMKDGIEQVLKVLKYSNDFQYYYNIEKNEVVIL